MTTFQAQGSFSGKNCFFCNSDANCRCLDCGPFMSLCESCAVDNHTNRNIFHHMEIFMDQRKLYPVIIDSLEEYRLYHHKLATLNFAVNCSGLDDGTVCPACPKSKGTLLESMDALFIGRKKMAGKSVRSPLFGDILFSNDYKVDKFVEQHPTRSGEGANVK